MIKVIITIFALSYVRLIDVMMISIDIDIDIDIDMSIDMDMDISTYSFYL